MNSTVAPMIDVLRTQIRHLPPVQRVGAVTAVAGLIMGCGHVGNRLAGSYWGGTSASLPRNCLAEKSACACAMSDRA
jgi:hypothetical protein